MTVGPWLQEPGLCSYVGCIGKDTFGDTMQSKCSAEGLNVPFMITETVPTGPPFNAYCDARSICRKDGGQETLVRWTYPLPALQGSVGVLNKRRFKHVFFLIFVFDFLK